MIGGTNTTEDCFFYIILEGDYCQDIGCPILEVNEVPPGITNLYNVAGVSPLANIWSLNPALPEFIKAVKQGDNLNLRSITNQEQLICNFNSYFSEFETNLSNIVDDVFSDGLLAPYDNYWVALDNGPGTDIVNKTENYLSQNGVDLSVNDTDGNAGEVYMVWSSGSSYTDADGNQWPCHLALIYIDYIDTGSSSSQVGSAKIGFRVVYNVLKP